MKMGEDVSDAELEEIIRVADKDGDGRIGWDDFYAVMTENPWYLITLKAVHILAE